MSQSQECPQFSGSSTYYWYITKPPQTLRISIAELLTYVPAHWIRNQHLNQAATVELLCTDILQSHIPRISVARLRELVPQVLNIPHDIVPTTKVLLPTARLALAYHYTTEQKAVDSHPEEKESLPFESANTISGPLAAPLVSSQGDIPKSMPPSEAPTLKKLSELSPSSSEDLSCRVKEWIQRLFGRQRALLLKGLGPSANSTPTESPISAETAVAPVINKQDEQSSLSGEQTKPAFFASLPKLVPKSVPPPKEPASAALPSPPQTSSASPASPTPSSFPFASESLPATQPPVAPPSDPVKNYPSEKTNQQAEVLDKQHLVTPLSQPLEPLSNESQLQTLLLTDERLSIRRVLDLCSQLPGIRGCVLAQGWEIVASSQPIGNLDPNQLGIRASELVENIRELSTKMGLGPIRAVTLFSTDGPVSFLRDQDLCFLIFHAHQERGFIPGVREKLQMVLAELQKSRLLIPPQAPTSKIEPLMEPVTSSN